ncbi:uncharacterized protein [Apostichopus japonicus]|uniref:uncharacterized protein n=1 Tax=Stichopus japonicus TaxID=307972 RepID=UPI003AB60B42
MKPQTTNYDLFKISHYVLIIGSFIGSISCGSNCNDFGLKNVATNEYDGDWEFYSFGNMDTSDCFLCARWWQSDETLKVFELLVPCLPENANGSISLNYFYSPSDTSNGNIAYGWERHTKDECKSFNITTSAISGGQTMYNSTAGKTNVYAPTIQIPPEYSNAPIILRFAPNYPEDKIFCIGRLDIEFQTVPMPTSAPKPKESSPTEIIELLRSSKITQTSENNNRWTSLWIITVAVVVILLLIFGYVGLLWYCSRRQKRGVARPDKPENNGTDVRRNQLVNHHGDVNDEMVYNGDPKYYSIEDGEVKIYALPYQEMFNNRDSHETVDRKAANKSKKTLKNNHLKNIQHTNKSFEQIDKAKRNGKMVNEASIKEENEYSKTIFTEKKEAVVFCDRGPRYINYKITGHTSSWKA